MLEVVFSDSAKGSMKLAQNYDEKSMLGGAIGFIGERPSKTELEKMFRGQPLGGSSADVVNIGFMLDVGDISGEVDGPERQDVFHTLWGMHNFSSRECEAFFRDQRDDVEKLLLAAQNGNPIRIWTSNAPYSACGFYYTCHLLRNIECEMYVITMPAFVSCPEDETITVSYSDWGEVEPGKFYRFLPFEQKLPSCEKYAYSNHWCGLIQEKSPLRAVVNGKLISVPETFYDHILSKSVPDDDFAMCQLVGMVMGEYDLGVSDSWYVSRIRQMVKENKLTVVGCADKTHPYGEILRKVEETR